MGGNTLTLTALLVQLVERWTSNPEVAGSSPVQGSYASIAQGLERLLCKLKVAGSIPVRSTLFLFIMNRDNLNF